MGGTTAPVSGSASWPAWIARVSNSLTPANLAAHLPGRTTFGTPTSPGGKGSGGHTDGDITLGWSQHRRRRSSHVRYGARRRHRRRGTGHRRGPRPRHLAGPPSSFAARSLRLRVRPHG